MKQQKQMGLVEILPPSAQKEVRGIVPVERFKALKWFNKLTEREQVFVKEEGQKLSAALMMEGIGRLAAGEQLLKLQQALEPKRVFLKYLVGVVKIHPRQAYRYINGYIAARDHLSEPVLKAAMARGMDIIGIKDHKKQPLGAYTMAFKKLGPPSRSIEPNKYLDQLEQMKKEIATRLRQKKAKGGGEVEITERDLDETLRESYRYVARNLKHLSNHDKKKFAKKLFGMLLSELGIGSAQTFEPEAVPQDYRPAPVGRPKVGKEEPAEKAAAS